LRPTGWPVRLHLLVEPGGDGGRKLVGRGDDFWATTTVDRKRQRRHRGIAAGKLLHVRHVRATPLVNRLVIVGDHAKVDRGLCQDVNELLLRRVDVLVLVHDQVSERAVDSLEGLWPAQGLYRRRDEQAVGEEVVA